MDKIEALAQELGIKAEEIEESDEGDNLFETPEGLYLVLTDSEANQAFRDMEEMLLDDLGIDLFSNDGDRFPQSKRFREWVLNNAIKINPKAVDDFIDSEIDYFEDEEPDENMLSYLNSLKTLEDKIDYIKELYGDGEEFLSWVKKINGGDSAEDIFDIDAICDEIKDSDGRGILANYDLVELELPGNFYAYKQ